MDERVVGDVEHPLVELRLGRQLPVQQQVGDLEEGRVLGQLLDGIAAVLEDAQIAVDVGDGAAAGGRVDEPGVVGGKPRLAFDGDLAEIGGTDGSVGDRDLVLTTRPVVANAERIGHAHNLRVEQGCAD